MIFFSLQVLKGKNSFIEYHLWRTFIEDDFWRAFIEDDFWRTFT